MKVRISLIVFSLVFAGFLGCEVLQPAEPIVIPPADPPVPGAVLVEAVQNSGPEDLVGAISIVAPAVLGPWGLVLAAVARAWYVKRNMNIAVRSVQPVVDKMTEGEKTELIKVQTPAAQRLIKQARGKSLNLPL